MARGGAALFKRGRQGPRMVRVKMASDLCAAVKHALITKGTEEDLRKRQCIQLEELPAEVQRSLINQEGQIIALNVQREGFLARLKDNEQTIRQQQSMIAHLNEVVAQLTRNNLKKECLRCEKQLDDAAVWAMFDAIDGWAHS